MWSFLPRNTKSRTLLLCLAIKRGILYILEVKILSLNMEEKAKNRYLGAHKMTLKYYKSTYFKFCITKFMIKLNAESIEKVFILVLRCHWRPQKIYFEKIHLF